ncbi:hypothetical protein [Mycobacteroides abscessus]|uniref:hypothetical protein n=1 Tax=Mycobacteroides abscessus TaxID=36809 RepID=UPI000C259DE3|nr:hypothetical protein [Mycobacteroides abscessus]MBN7559866.1 hypothetical protein [Mycobacteroides abscessus subsp. abscessus]
MEKPPAVVVFDVNIYVDLAELIEQPFDWGKLEAAAAGYWNDPLPHHRNARYDSLRAVLMSKSGHVGTGERLEVWTSEHIDNLVIKKVQQKAVDTTNSAWTPRNAMDLHDELVNTLVYDMTRGGSVGRVLDPLNHPPLDHEDGCVMRTVESAGDMPESPRYCITRDGPFREAFRRNELEPSVQVLYPHEWVIALRQARRPRIPMR